MTTTTPTRDPVARVHHRGRIAVTIACSLMVALGVISAGAQWKNAAALDAQNRSDEIASCRSAYRIELVDAPQLDALKAIAQGDDEALADAVGRADVDRYERLNRRARLDPDGFLRACRKANP